MAGFNSSFFKLPSNGRFMYRPRHFDEKKEELEKRIKLIEANYKRKTLEGINYREEWGDSLADKWRNRETNTRTAEFQRYLRIFSIVVFFCIVAYIVFWL